LELAWSWQKNLKLYRLNDAITNISCGIGQQILGIVFKTVIFFGYFWLYENARIFSIPSNWFWWIVLFIGVDFCYYWFHRMGHEVNAIWATHVVHHQSEDYNLSVALRQSWFQSFFSNLFYLPLAVLGFDPFIAITVIAFNTLYQFWIHTELIRNMGWFELVFNTPSHHRVHHGSNPKYIDKNHGGTLIIWDRIFGTFQQEDEKVVYGITTPLNSWNPLWANFHYWKELISIASRSKGFNKIKVFLAMPGWSPDENKIQSPDFSVKEKFDLPLQKHEKIYVLLQFALVLGFSSWILMNESSFNLVQMFPSLLWGIFAIISIGNYMDLNKRRFILELIRLSLFPLVIIPVVSFLSAPFIIVSITALCSLAWLLVLESKHTYKLVKK
jgi:sterol desaturase/sphingolipid hydroxylase (fatty acid hydroxylase superfamily)